MKNKLATIFIGLLFAACGQTHSENSTSSITEVDQTKHIIKNKKEKAADSIASAKQDSLSKIYEAEQKEKFKIAIEFAEKDFFSSLKGVDKDFGENNYSKMQKVLKKHSKSPHDLYIELTDIFRKSKEEATQAAISAGLKERKYTDFISKIEDWYVGQFQSKYGIDNRLYICFKNNYCSCLGDNSDKYCSGRQPIFPNSEFWK